MSLAERAA
jgi:transposase